MPNAHNVVGVATRRPFNNSPGSQLLASLQTQRDSDFDSNSDCDSDSE